MNHEKAHKAHYQAYLLSGPSIQVYLYLHLYLYPCLHTLLRSPLKGTQESGL